MKKSQMPVVISILISAVIIGYSALVSAKAIDNFIPPGYKVARTMRLSKKAHGVGGKLYLLADESIDKWYELTAIGPYKPLILVGLNKEGEKIGRFTYQVPNISKKSRSEDITGNGQKEIILVPYEVGLSDVIYVLPLYTIKDGYLVEIPILDDKDRAIRLESARRSDWAFVPAVDNPERKDIVYWISRLEEDGYYTSYWEFRFHDNAYRGRLLKKRKEYREDSPIQGGRQEFKKMLQGSPQFP